MRAARRLTLIGFVAVSLVAAIISARIGFGSDGWLWNLDLPKIHYPLASMFNEALAEGRLPLWSDRLGMGFPLYAEGQIGAFYPPNWLIFRLEPLSAMDLSRLLHLTLGGVGAGLLALRISGSRAGAIVAILITVLGGAIATKLEWWNLVAAYGWLPWILLPLAGRSAPGRVALATSGVLWGVQALAGHPNTWLLTGLAAVLLLIGRPFLPAVARIAGFVVIGVAVGAAQLLPTLLLQNLSVRSLGLSANDLFTSASTPFDIIGLGFVNAFVRSDPDGAWSFPTTWYPDGIFALLEASAYVGLPAIGLAGLGLVHRRARRWVLLGLVAAAIGIVAAFRPDWWQATPLLNGLRSPVRSYLVITLVIAVLAAIGASRLGRDAGRGRAGLRAMGVVMAAYVVVAVAARSVPALFDWLLSLSVDGLPMEAARATRANAVPALTSLWPLSLELAIGVAMGAILLRRRSRFSVTAAVIAVALPLAMLSPLANPLRPATDLTYASSQFVATLVAQAPRRVLTVNPPGYYSGMPNQLAAAGIADVDMFSSLNLRGNDAMVRQLRDADPDGLLRRAVGVDLVVTFDMPCPGRQVAEVPEHGAAICRDDAALAPPYWIPSAAVTAGQPNLERVVAEHRALTVVQDRLLSLELMVDQPEAGWVYVDRAWWTGWRATVDGADVEARSSMGGQLIEVPPGRHAIVLSLVPWDALLGLALGILAIAASAAWLWVGARRDRSWNDPSGEPVHRGGPHPPGVDDEADGNRHGRLEAEAPADAVCGQHEEKRVEVLRVAVSELRSSGISVEQDGDKDRRDRRPAADDEPGR